MKVGGAISLLGGIGIGIVETNRGQTLAVSIEPPSSLSATTVTLQGSLDALGDADAATVTLRYRERHSDQRGEWTTVTRRRVSSPGSITGQAVELRPDTDYEAQAVATVDNRSVTSDRRQFRTTDTTTDTPSGEKTPSPGAAPAVSVGSPSSVTATSATLHGTIDDLGSEATAEAVLRYRRTDGGDGDWTVADRETVTEPEPITGEAADLRPDTGYEVVAVASTKAGTTVSDRQRFTTSRSPNASPFRYTDGFADVDWFDDNVDVYRIQEPTVDALDAALTASGPRLVVFETSGTIDLQEYRPTIDHDYCWVAGQTAPSPGITLVEGDLHINADNCVVQHLRVRPGDAGNDDGWAPDAIRTGDGTTNNIIDHCSATWSVDENISPGYDAVDTTISNCLIAEALNDASHPKGEHSMGMLVGDRSTGNTIVGNLFTLNKRRNPRLKVDSESIVANNLVDRFNTATVMGAAGTAIIEANDYLRPNADYLVKGSAHGDHVPDAYVEDNATDGDTKMTNGQLDRLHSRPFWPDDLTLVSVEEMRQRVLSSVGARPADRTAHDRRIVESVRERTGTEQYIDSQSEVGGYPDLPEHTRSLDVPDSNLRQWLEERSRAVSIPT